MSALPRSLLPSLYFLPCSYSCCLLPFVLSCNRSSSQSRLCPPAAAFFCARCSSLERGRAAGAGEVEPGLACADAAEAPFAAGKDLSSSSSSLQPQSPAPPASSSSSSAHAIASLVRRVALTLPVALPVPSKEIVGTHFIKKGCHNVDALKGT